MIIPDEVKESFPRADSWLKMLKKCDKEDATLIAVVSSQIACKGALTAGAACIAVERTIAHKRRGGRGIDHPATVGVG